MKIVVVGNGMAGARVAAELSTMDVTVLGAETHPAYNRILLSSVLAGKHRSHDIGLVGGTKARLGVTVSSIDRSAKTVTTDSGERLEYDHLHAASNRTAQTLNSGMREVGSSAGLVTSLTPG